MGGAEEHIRLNTYSRLRGFLWILHVTRYMIRTADADTRMASAKVHYNKIFLTRDWPPYTADARQWASELAPLEGPNFSYFSNRCSLLVQYPGKAGFLKLLRR